VKKKSHKLIMVGPALDGLGGISRVVKIWQENSFFSGFNVKYIAPVTDIPSNRFFFLIKGILNYIFASYSNCLFVYIHTSSFNSFRRKSLFIIIALLFKNKVLLHIHPTHFYSFLSECSFFEKKFNFFLLKRINLFVVLTEEMKKYVQTLFPEKKVMVLRNPINVEKMKKTENFRRVPYRLLYLGWYIKEKGVYELVDAIEILLKKGIKIQAEFFGTKNIEELSDYVAAKKLTEQIRIKGWINNGNKLKALYECTALILPSHSEGIPNVILEAMATKTPIIATSVGGLRELLKDSENAIIAEVNNPRDLSKKILRCLENKELRHRISENAYRNVCMKHDVRIIKQEFRKIVKFFTF
jgi:glycosyltransferase involved in cell wall biosynthesis